jgi:N-methylhydantoinase A
MVAFGGSGPLHGARIARKLRIPRVICPAGAGVMSAFGLLSSPIGFEVARSRRIGMAELSDATLRDQLAALRQEAEQKLLLAGVPTEAASCLTHLDIRYEGQGYEVEVGLPEPAGALTTASVRDAFDTAYHVIFGASFPERPAEIVNWKAEAFGPVPGEGRDYTLRSASTTGPVRKAERAAWNPDTGRMELWPVIDRYALSPGDEIAGPALIEERESTFVVGPQDRMRVDAHLNLVVEIGEIVS